MANADRARRSSATLRRSALLLASALACAACSDEAPTRGEASIPPDAAPAPATPIYERAGRPLGAVHLLRPEGGVELPFDVYLAPLIVQELAPDRSTPAPVPGSVALDEQGHPSVVAGRPTVYYARSRAALGGAEREQLAFLWWYPEGAGGARAQGLRMTLGEGGVPIVWEVLSDASGARLVFVSETLEELARLHHGEPAPGRRFSIERPASEAPSAVVARAISNGAAPLGPYVYLESGARVVRTLLCRCSPAEHGELAGESLYELRPLESLAELGLAQNAWSAALPAPIVAARVEGPDDADPRWLERNLRLPPGL